MMVLGFQAVQFPRTLDHCYLPRCRSSSGGGNVIIQCGIAEPSGQTALLGEKTKYNDGFFEKAFMTLFATMMEKFAGNGKKDRKGGLFDYDYESFVEVSKRVMQGRSRMQQREVVREVLLSMLPPGAPAQVVEVEINGVKQRSGSAGNFNFKYYVQELPAIQGSVANPRASVCPKIEAREDFFLAQLQSC